MEYLSILLLSFTFCLPRLHLAWQIFRTRAAVNLFNYSLGACVAVAGKEMEEDGTTIQNTYQNWDTTGRVLPWPFVWKANHGHVATLSGVQSSSNWTEKNKQICKSLHWSREVNSVDWLTADTIWKRMKEGERGWKLIKEEWMKMDESG